MTTAVENVVRSCKCKNKSHPKRIKKYPFTYTRKKDGVTITKIYQYEVCYTCLHRAEVKRSEYKINRELAQNKGLTELERTLLTYLRSMIGQNRKGQSRLFRINQAIQTSLRKRNTL